MKEYQKLETVFIRDIDGTKKLIEGKYRNPIAPPFPFQLVGNFHSRNNTVGDHLSDGQSQLGIFTRS